MFRPCLGAIGINPERVADEAVTIRSAFAYRRRVTAEGSSVSRSRQYSPYRPGQPLTPVAGQRRQGAYSYGGAPSRLPYRARRALVVVTPVDPQARVPHWAA